MDLITSDGQTYWRNKEICFDAPLRYFRPSHMPARLRTCTGFVPWVWT